MAPPPPSTPLQPEGTGFNHNLTDEQVKRLKQMWSFLDYWILTPGWPGGNGKEEQKKMSPPAGSQPLTPATKKLLDAADLQKMTRDFWLVHKGFPTADIMVLKFLRARKWDVKAAFDMLVAAADWRVRFGVEDEIVQGGEIGLKELCEKHEKGQGAKFEHQFGSGKAYFWGTDKTGRPVVYIHVKLHSIPYQSQFVMQKYTIYLMEVARTLIPAHADIPQEQAVLVFDMSGFTLANMDFNFVKFLLEAFESKYPETLGKALIHGAPWIFSGAWKIIRPWMDPVVASKVDFTKKTADLLEFIDENNLPTRLGGKCPYDYKYVTPAPEEKAMSVSTEEIIAEFGPIAKEYHTATQEWYKSAPGADAEAKSKRVAAGKALQEHYLKFDPHYRAATFYNRVGVVPHDDSGTVNWDFAKVKEAEKSNAGRIVEPITKMPK